MCPPPLCRVMWISSPVLQALCGVPLGCYRWPSQAAAKDMRSRCSAAGATWRASRKPCLWPWLKLLTCAACLCCRHCVARFQDCPVCGADITRREPDAELQGERSAVPGPVTGCLVCAWHGLYCGPHLFRHLTNQSGTQLHPCLHCRPHADMRRAKGNGTALNCLRLRVSSSAATMSSLQQACTTKQVMLRNMASMQLVQPAGKAMHGRAWTWPQHVPLCALHPASAGRSAA